MTDVEEGRAIERGNEGYLVDLIREVESIKAELSHKPTAWGTFFAVFGALAVPFALLTFFMDREFSRIDASISATRTAAETASENSLKSFQSQTEIIQKLSDFELAMARANALWNTPHQSDPRYGQLVSVIRQKLDMYAPHDVRVALENAGLVNRIAFSQYNGKDWFFMVPIDFNKMNRQVQADLTAALSERGAHFEVLSQAEAATLITFRASVNSFDHVDSPSQE